MYALIPSVWDTSNVIDMYYAFRGASSFNSDLSSWNTSRVTKMERMFNGATSFNSDISSWDIGSVTNLNDMFQGATSFNQNLCAWGETFPYNPEYSGFEYNVVNDMFLDSGCTYQDTPQEDTALKNEPVLEEENVVLLEDDSNFDDW
jgi:surface protein